MIPISQVIYPFLSSCEFDFEDIYMNVCVGKKIRMGGSVEIGGEWRCRKKQHLQNGDHSLSTFRAVIEISTSLYK